MSVVPAACVRSAASPVAALTRSGQGWAGWRSVLLFVLIVITGLLGPAPAFITPRNGVLPARLSVRRGYTGPPALRNVEAPIDRPSGPMLTLRWRSRYWSTPREADHAAARQPDLP